MWMLTVSGLLSTIFLFHPFDLVSCAPPAIGIPCANPDVCPFVDGCVNNTDSGKHVCICRLQHMNPDGLSWKDNFTACTINYSPWNINSEENGTRVASPFYQYERLPNRVMKSTITVYKPYYARLKETEGQGGWCGMKVKGSLLEVAVGEHSIVTMIATQGLGKSAVAFYTKTFLIRKVYYDENTGSNKEDWYRDSNGNKVEFKGNEDNDGIVYNFFDPPITGALAIRVQPVVYENNKCLRLELYGRRVTNECEVEKWSQCHPSATCTDNIASYNCTCPVGWRDLMNDGFKCESIDECKGENDCHKDANCKDSPSSYECVCKVGYQGDGKYCEDKDECEDETHLCHSNAYCTNTIGSYTCTCRSGYEGDGTAECNNIDECKKNLDDCHENAKCTDLKGSFDCICKNGYDGNGRHCVDVDECKRGRPCHPKATCTNKIGFYICKCLPGYEGSGFWCSDIDECKKGIANCKPSERCYNLVGDYVCMCPKHIPRQMRYINQTEIDILDGLLKNVRDLSVQDWQYSLYYHAHIIRDIYRLVKLTYGYHFKEVRDAFYITSVQGSSFGVEAYDFRCTEVPHLRFPNLCHKSYEKTEFAEYTDAIDMYLVEQQEVTAVFDSWATTPTPTPPQPGRTTPTLPPVPTQRRLTTRIELRNGTNVTVTEAPRTTPALFTNCSEYRNDDEKIVESPSDESGEFYPPNTKCVWEIQAPPLHDVYVTFEGRFELEFDPKCYYDFVQIFDGSLNGKELGRFCGNRTSSPIQSIRSGHGKLVVVFETDNTEQFFGFTFNYAFLNPRAAVICVSYNLMSTLPNSYKQKWKKEIENEEKDRFVPISRMLACKQYPKCNVTRPKRIRFTFEHFRYDRNDKRCIHWSIDEHGSYYHQNPCRQNKTNLTHTICDCHSWGVVTVLGRDTASRDQNYYSRYQLGRNCFISVLLVTLGLIFTVFFLFFKDQWAAAMFEVFTKKEYDSGRLIQMHILFQTLLVELFFCVITFDVEAEIGACYFLALLFYYLIQTVFFWLFVYTLFLQSRLKEIFDSSKYNSYRIYLFIGYGIPVIVMLTVTGLSFPKQTQFGVCWLLFTGTTVWGFSGVIVTLGVVTLILLLHVTYKARKMEGGITLQHKCLRTMFTTFFVLLTSIFGTLALQERHYHYEWFFSVCNMMQGFSITIMYCILRREDAIIRANQIGPLPSKEDDEDEELQKFLDEEDEVSFADMQDEQQEEDDEDEGTVGGEETQSEKDRHEIPSWRRERVIRFDQEEEKAAEDAVVDEPLEEESEESEDNEMEFMEDEPIDYNTFNASSTLSK